MRKDFTASEMVAVKRHLEPKLKKQAKKRQGTRTDLEEHRGNFPQSEKTRDIIGKVVGVSGRTLEKAERIVEAVNF